MINKIDNNEQQKQTSKSVLNYLNNRNLLKNFKANNKSIISVSGIDEVGKTTLIKKLVNDFPDQIISFNFPTKEVRSQIFELGNIKITDYSSFTDVYNYNMVFRKDLIENLNLMLTFLKDHKILLLDRSIIDHICYFNFDLIKFVKEKSAFLNCDSLLLDHKQFINYLCSLKDVEFNYITPQNITDSLEIWLNFINACIFIHVPYEKISSGDSKYNKDELFAIQKIFDQILESLYNNHNPRLKKLDYLPVEGLINDSGNNKNSTYNEIKKYLVDYHGLVIDKK